MQDQKQSYEMDTRVAVIYRKSDGKIVRVSTLSAHIAGRVTEQDMNIFLPGIEDLSDFNMVFVKGKQYLEIDRYRVEVDADGKFIDVVEKTDVLSPFSEENVQVDPKLLDREADIVISVLGVVDDPIRLLKYKELEVEGQNRSEIINFFREKGI